MHLNRISLIILATVLLAGCNLIGQGGSDLPTPTPNILPTIESVVDQRLAQFLALTPTPDPTLTPGPSPTLGPTPTPTPLTLWGGGALSMILDLNDLPAGWYLASQTQTAEVDYGERRFDSTTQSGPTLFVIQGWVHPTEEGAQAHYDSLLSLRNVSVTQNVVLDGTIPGLVSYLSFASGTDGVVRPQVYFQVTNAVIMVGYEDGTSRDAIDAANLAATKLLENL